MRVQAYELVTTVNSVGGNTQHEITYESQVLKAPDYHELA